MTRNQTERLASAVMYQVGNLMEVWDEIADQHDLQDIDPNEAQRTLAKWMSKLPGKSWDTRLGPPP